MITVYLTGGGAVCCDVEAVRELRDRWHCCGVLVGTLPSLVQQNRFLSVPLQLSQEETAWLAQQGAVRVLDGSSDVTAEFIGRSHGDGGRAAIYAALRDQYAGVYVLPGARFGGLYVLYPGDPLRFHARHVVYEEKGEEPWDLLNCVVAAGRLGNSVHKRFIIASNSSSAANRSEQQPGRVAFFTVEWAGFG